MELRNLITFTHVAELGSFTKAAEQLGYSQSTISFQIKQLEEELGCLLFERINHTITLTKRGHELVMYAHQVRALTDEFKESLIKDEEISGHIHIVTPDSVCDDMINSHYIDFHNKYPNISIKFTTADTLVMFDMLDHNEADVIITLDNHSYKKDYVIAKEEPLSMHFVASSKSKFAGVKGLSIKDIVNEPFILTEYGQGYRRVFDKELAKRSLDITPVLEIGRTDIITTTVANSDMISFLPDFVTKPLIDSGELIYIDVCDMNLEIWKQLIYHKNKWISKSLKTVIEYIIANDFFD
ncbi:MAG: LysR family transcriptional regulator [Clostridia bacterium]|nr:LysR family transcriptional regulator [Clostridia bacterium]MEE0898894.1 LysR family transcriptional regulator [Acutalibacteraceae bacterium]MEE1173748.1 LysR family transcriptional regulator [Ruminococcus sp.]MBQ5597227.1 LysR family transcriptional regulator [Clostridia bacterium]MEE0967801.1 LysR family transcriptional regulator [Clostridia bacterium]